MEQKWGYQRELAGKVGVTPSTINSIVHRKSLPSVALAKELEKATGISRLAWLYPDEFANPLIKASNGNKAA